MLRYRGANRTQLDRGQFYESGAKTEAAVRDRPGEAAVAAEHASVGTVGVVAATEEGALGVV